MAVTKVDPVVHESMTRLLKEATELRERSEVLERELKNRCQKRTSIVDYGDSDEELEADQKCGFTEEVAKVILMRFNDLQSELGKLFAQQDDLSKRIAVIEKQARDDGVDMDKLKLEEDPKAADESFFGAFKPYVQDALEKINKRLDTSLVLAQQKLDTTNARVTANEGEVATLRFLVNEQANQPTPSAQSAQPFQFSQPSQWSPQPDGQQLEDNQRRQERAIDGLLDQQALVDAYRELSSDKLMIPNSDVHTYMSWSGTYIQIDALRLRVCRRLALRSETVNWKEFADKMTARWEKEKREGW